MGRNQDLDAIPSVLSACLVTAGVLFDMEALTGCTIMHSIYAIQSNARCRASRPTLESAPPARRQQSIVSKADIILTKNTQLYQAQICLTPNHRTPPVEDTVMSEAAPGALDEQAESQNETTQSSPAPAVNEVEKASLEDMFDDDDMDDDDEFSSSAQVKPQPSSQPEPWVMTSYRPDTN